MFSPRCIRLPVNLSNKNNYKYDCNFCEEGGWTSETELEFHNADNHFPRFQKLPMQQSKEKFVCLTCVTKHNNSKSLLKHIKSEHLLSSEDSKRVEREIFICHHCQQIFFNKDLIAMHMSHKHLAKKVFQCQLCPKKVKACSVRGHYIFHQLQSVSSCPICLKKCSNRLHLKEHIESHKKYYHCGECDYKTNKAEYFERHRCCVKLKDNNIVNCKQYFLKPIRKSSWSYSVHFTPMKGVRLWNKVFICVLCREICTSYIGMKRHINKDHSLKKKVVRKKQYMCLCGEVFVNGLLLKHHVFKMKGSHRVLKAYEEPKPLLAPIFNESKQPFVIEDTTDVPFTRQEVLHTGQTEVVLLPEQTHGVRHTRQNNYILITEQIQDPLHIGLPEDVLHTGQTQDIVFNDNTIIIIDEDN